MFPLLFQTIRMCRRDRSRAYKNRFVHRTCKILRRLICNWSEYWKIISATWILDFQILMTIVVFIKSITAHFIKFWNSYKSLVELKWLGEGGSPEENYSRKFCAGCSSTLSKGLVSNLSCRMNVLTRLGTYIKIQQTISSCRHHNVILNTPITIARRRVLEYHHVFIYLKKSLL